MSEELSEIVHENEIFLAELEDAVSTSGEERLIQQFKIMEPYRTRLSSAIDRMNQMIEPTYHSFASKKTGEELMQRALHRIQPIFNTLNECLTNSWDNHDAIKCQKRATEQLETEGMNDLKELLREY